MKSMHIKSKESEYPVIIQDHLLDVLHEHLMTSRFYVIISDDLIPSVYIDKVIFAFPNHLMIRFPAGEHSKSFSEYQRIIRIMQENNVSRDACVIALGGGVTGDLAGFVAATYMRGIDYVQIPTTLLAQIDSSIGGKVAINTDLAKNSVGQFYPPIKVLIDPLTLETLSERHFNNGMAEMIKYGMIHSEKLFQEMETMDLKLHLEHFIYESLLIKKYYVENDEFDRSIRQLLNFGHTFGHAYETYYSYNKYLHGEAVALGMIKGCENLDTRARLVSLLKKFNLPIEDAASDLDLLPYIVKDKKNTHEHIHIIVVDQIGKAKIKKYRDRV